MFTFLDHPEITADNDTSERDLRPTATCRKVTSGFRPNWADLFAAAHSTRSHADDRAISARQATRDTLSGLSVLLPVERPSKSKTYVSKHGH
jgi:transposase